MEIVKELVQQAYERLEDLDFYESWTDSKVSTILEKLRSVENDIDNLRDTIENSKVMPSFKTPIVYGVSNPFPVIGTSDPYFKKYTPWDHRIPDSVTPDYRDQWRYETNGDKLHREILRTSNGTETNGDLIAKEWTKFMETASNEEKIKALTEIVRTLVPGTSV